MSGASTFKMAGLSGSAMSKTIASTASSISTVPVAWTGRSSRTASSSPGSAPAARTSPHCRAEPSTGWLGIATSRCTRSFSLSHLRFNPTFASYVATFSSTPAGTPTRLPAPFGGLSVNSSGLRRLQVTDLVDCRQPASPVYRTIEAGDELSPAPRICTMSGPIGS